MPKALQGVPGDAGIAPVTGSPNNQRRQRSVLQGSPDFTAAEKVRPVWSKPSSVSVLSCTCIVHLYRQALQPRVHLVHTMQPFGESSCLAHLSLGRFQHITHTEIRACVCLQVHQRAKPEALKTALHAPVRGMTTRSVHSSIEPRRGIRATSCFENNPQQVASG